MNEIENNIVLEHKVNSDEKIDSVDQSNETYNYPNDFKLDSNYPSWCIKNGATISSEEIYKLFKRLGSIFGFQNDNIENMYDHFMTQLDSRSSRMTCKMALLSLHVDYIGGSNSNYKKWYFSTQIRMDYNISDSKQWGKYIKSFLKSYNKKKDISFNFENFDDFNSFASLDYYWKLKMNNLSEEEYIAQVSLYLLIWGEANNIRFIPECLCFIFHCALDHYDSVKSLSVIPTLNEFHFLNSIIDPLYDFLRKQQFDNFDGKWYKNSKDHLNIIGYDDMNQFFWFSENLKSIRITNGNKLYDFLRGERYMKIGLIDWNNVFYKTYKEKRTWMHILTNFNRVWIIHFSMYWFYVSFNSSTLFTKNYDRLRENKPPTQLYLSVVSLGGFISCLISLTGLYSEFFCISKSWPGSPRIKKRFFLVLILSFINFAPSVYIFFFLSLENHSYHGTIIAILQFIIAIITFLYLSIEAPQNLFNFVLKKRSNTELSGIFNTSFPNLSIKSQILSSCLWICVFLLKFFESYFFVILSLKDPVRILSIMEMKSCDGDIFFKTISCKYQPLIILFLIYVVDFTLFYLDTYLWYIICNCILSIALTFASGVSIFTPWKNIFSRLPDRILTKLLFLKFNSKNDSIIEISQIWNSIIISMYREHLFSIEQVKRLLYHQIHFKDENFTKVSIKPPLFFIFQDDNSFNLNEIFTPKKDAERRILFFAQSLSSPLPDPIPTLALPCFTVLIPHYSEKILLSLKEIIKETKDSKVTLLEYLKKLHPEEWDCFVKDNKKHMQLTLTCGSEDKNISDSESLISKNEHNDKVDLNKFIKNQIDDLPLNFMGFKNCSPEFVFRTRIWSSLRYQTLYRTITGFMNYKTAIKLLYKVENFTYDEFDDSNFDKTLEKFVKRKFRLLLSMQNYYYFDDEEKESVDFLCQTFPDINISVLKETTDDYGNVHYYSVLLDLSKKDDDGYSKKYEIKLSGNPILGDGKSDNQNMALIFYRGEYIQVIDANQDNYLEECLKIKSILAEFEEMDIDPSSQYVPGNNHQTKKAPIAFIGAREYIFSENIGVLGDIAAGKEQTFGTLFSRTMAEIGCKLHYGHPDFLNAIFMTTRGGISKAQKGLHLNEDIYAGINAISRGGRIKNCDFYQCAKGRDLGFGTILNFVIKIGSGMGEQILSREYYYLGTLLSIDRFLSFYYSHAGFHINNVFIMLSVEIFMLLLINLGALRSESILCFYNPNASLSDPELPVGCHNIQPVLSWISRFVLSVCICFFISFLPLFIQELMEKGFTKAIIRVFYHLISFSPFFEVVICQTYSKSLRDNITFGHAKYIATRRGITTHRASFATLYSTYGNLFIYKGSKFFLVILFASVTIWQFSLIWFWIITISLCLAPFFFNPHQFELGAFFMDYKEFIRWLSRGNRIHKENSWIEYIRRSRSKITGYKKRTLKTKELFEHDKKMRKFNIVLDLIILSFVKLFFYFISYMFINSNNMQRHPKSLNLFLRLIIISILPFIGNILILIIFLPLQAMLNFFFGFFIKRLPSVLAGFTHLISLAFYIITLEVFLFLENMSYIKTLCGLLFVISFQHIINQFVLIFFFSKELKEDVSNRAWWSGRWFKRGLGWLIFTQPLREFFAKIMELNLFVRDFILGHFLLFSMIPFIIVPFMDKWHSSMLFWLKPNNQFIQPIYSKKQKNKRRFAILRYGILFFLVFTFFSGAIIGPIFLKKEINELKRKIPQSLMGFMYPNT